MDVLLFYVTLPLVPILLFMFNSDRKAAGRTWGCHFRVCFVVLREAVKAEFELWLYILVDSVSV